MVFTGELSRRVYQESLRKLYISVGILMLSTITGVLGYVIVEDFTFQESFYMTIITISTVGFREVRPLSEAGRLFTTFYIIGNFLIFAYLVSTITTYLFGGKLNQALRFYLMSRAL